MFQTIRMSVTPETAQVVPGGQLLLALDLHNASAIVDRYHVAVSGVPEEWVHLDAPSVALFPGAHGAVQFTVQPPSGTAAGRYTLAVQASSEDDPSRQARVEVALEVGTVGGVVLELRPAVAQGREATFRLRLRNQSNAAVVLGVEARDNEEGLRFTLTPSEAQEVPAGGEREVEARVVPKVRETIGEPHPYEIEFRGVRAEAPEEVDPRLVRQARFTYVPRYSALVIPPWLRRLPLWALILLLLLLVLLLFFAGNGVTRAAIAITTHPSPTPRPTATQMPTATATPIAPTATHVPTATATAVPPTATAVPLPAVGSFKLTPGAHGAMQVVWAVTGTRMVTLNGQPVAANGSRPLSHMTTVMTFVLRATSASGTVTRFLQVKLPHPAPPTIVPLPTVQLGLPVINFASVVDPQTTQRSLTWTVSGAQTVTLNGASVKLTGRLTVAPSAAGSYVLQASNKLGTVRSTLTLVAGTPVASGTEVAIPAPKVQSFTLVHARPGQPYRLVWQTADADSVTLNGAPVKLRGSRPLPAPVRGGTYTLVATNSSGRATATVTVVVRGATSSPQLSMALPRGGEG